MRAAKVEIQDPRPENIARFALESALKNNERLIVVEDSGLFIEGLSGFPGPYSSFVYETIGLKGILSLLRSSRNRRAYFQSSVAAGSRRRSLVHDESQRRVRPYLPVSACLRVHTGDPGEAATSQESRVQLVPAADCLPRSRQSSCLP